MKNHLQFENFNTMNKLQEPNRILKFYVMHHTIVIITSHNTIARKFENQSFKFHFQTPNQLKSENDFRKIMLNLIQYILKVLKIVLNRHVSRSACTDLLFDSKSFEHRTERNTAFVVFY